VVNRSSERGFSFIEIVVVVAIIGIMGALAVGVTMTSVNASKADSSTSALMNILELARNQSTSQRRDFQLVFTAPNQVQVIRLDLPSGTTLIANRYLENSQAFVRFGSLSDPDNFGHVDDTDAISFGSTPTIRFTTDGTLIDSSGDVLNGTLFLGKVNEIGTARAISIFGATGLIRSWKWNGTAWVN